MSVGGVSSINHGVAENFSGNIGKILSQFQTAVFLIFEELGRLFKSYFSFKCKPDATLIELDKEGAVNSTPQPLKEISGKANEAATDASTPLSQSIQPARPKMPAPSQQTPLPKQSLGQSEKETSDAALTALKGVTTFFGIGTFLLSLCSEAPALKPLLEPLINETAKDVIPEIPLSVGKKILEYCPAFSNASIIETITCTIHEGPAVIETVAEETAACCPDSALAVSDVLMAGASGLTSRITALAAEMGETRYALLGTIFVIGGLYATHAYRAKLPAIDHETPVESIEILKETPLDSEIAIFEAPKEQIEEEIKILRKKFGSGRLKFNDRNVDSIGPFLLRLMRVNDPYFYEFSNELIKKQKLQPVIKYLEELNDKFIEFKKSADSKKSRNALLAINFVSVTRSVIRNFEHICITQNFPADLHIDEYEKKQ